MMCHEASHPSNQKENCLTKSNHSNVICSVLTSHEQKDKGGNIIQLNKGRSFQSITIGGTFQCYNRPEQKC